MPDLTCRLMGYEGDHVGSLSLALQDYMRVPQGARILNLQFRCPNLQTIKSPAIASRGIEEGKQEARDKAELLGTKLKEDGEEPAAIEEEEDISQFEVLRLECQAQSPFAVFVDCFCGESDLMIEQHLKAM